MAPQLANLLLDCMLENKAIEPSLQWRRREDKTRGDDDLRSDLSRPPKR
jgi:hypothetical protein